MESGRGPSPYHIADELYRQGLAALVLRRPAEALWAFQSALKLQRSIGVIGNWRCLSYFGLSLAMAEGVSAEAMRACETALKNGREDGQLYLNLGQVYLLAGRVGKAIQTFEDGVRAEPENAELRAALSSSDRRKPPVLPLLSRDHPLNVRLGKWRARRARRPGGTARP